MAEKFNATCSICGRPYYKCISCKDAMALNPWKSFCDTAEHYKVHQIIRAFNGGVYTKDEARDKFKCVDIFDINEFRPNIKQIVEDILKEDKPVKNEEVISEPVMEDSVDDSMTEINEMIIEKPVSSRKKNYKVEDKQ